MLPVNSVCHMRRNFSEINRSFGTRFQKVSPFLS